ncbi:glycosyltransferase [Nocardioides caeni]|uniref:Beta-monoglucosyldiacylglycerol synthase n=2 Tax=Nocardioides caeni TaxID=574700 RepID=A0A4S8NJ77_9ACTN|nr:glycosyltransferase [Nocardioides caeni]
MLVWGVRFLAGLSLSTPSTALLWSALALSIVTVPSAVVTTREGWEPLLQGRRHDDRRRRPPRIARFPKVSIHVPVHAEPPEVVIATLDRLARLDYPDFEVLVVDNNTEDPELWRPVEEQCRRLGGRFRFFHVDGITGAKAGALNWVLPHADPAAELIAVVDADYHVEPSWLQDTVGHFAEPRMGFVQAPHAYRGHEGSRFATWANWEYAVFFRTGMVSLDRHGAGLTVGTMSLIRTSALVEAGGWAEWCLTEDSELSIRIHALGYHSVYLTEPYGRGLVPPTFEAYRRQRFRWTYGPVQELGRHGRLFLPSFLGGRGSELTRSQRLHHANHGIDVAGIGVRAIALGLGVAGAGSMVIHDEVVRMPFELWLGATASLLGSWVLRLLVHRRVVGASLGQAVGATLAFASLSLVITVASLRATCGVPAQWHRTTKFRPRSSALRAIRGASTETLTGSALLALGVALLTSASGGSGLVVMVAIALFAKGLVFLSATAMALMADRDLRRAVVRPQVEFESVAA